MAIFFGSREVKEFSIPKAVREDGTEYELDEVLVEYKEGKPQFEAVPKAEWEKGQTDRALTPSEKAKWFVERTTKLRTDIHKVFEAQNPRFGEIGRVLEWIHETYRQAFVKAVELKTGVNDFVTEGTFDHIVEAHTTNGSDQVEKLPQLTADILDVLRKHKVKVGEVIQGGLLSTIQKDLEMLADKGFSLIIGSDDEHRRCNDLVDIFDLYGNAQKPSHREENGGEQTSVEDHSPSVGEDSGTLEDASGSSTEGSQGDGSSESSEGV